MSDEACLCGSGLESNACCTPYVFGAKRAPTAEALMRSRYVAFCHKQIDYISRTMRGPAKANYDLKGTEAWIAGLSWDGLEILEEKTSVSQDKAIVEFIAHYREAGVQKQLHERSVFKKYKRIWYYVDTQPTQQERPK